MTNNILWNQAVIAAAAKIVECAQKVLCDLEASATMNEFMETNGGNSGRLDAISSQQ